ncbi:hypothetical protein [Dermabacter hominis]|uniref:hypothetical protein n=1 Tax=Dermabacter hominis TaxID=36740 RepID=UPI0021A41A93|nr:hypothetical protein [Dermabacter hominis]MCT1716157.1 hypothetical protein [Dermabacter hominis]
MKAIVRMSAVATAAALTFGFGAAANAETVDCNDLTAEQKADLEYAAMGIISVPADLQKCVGQWDTPTRDEGAAAENDYSDAAEKEYNKNTQPEWDTPTGDEGAAAENDYLDAAEKEYNKNTQPEWDTPTRDEAAQAENDYLDAAEKEYNKNNEMPEWDTPTRDEAAQAENDYLDAAEKEYNRLNEQNNAEMPSDNNGEEKVTDGEAGTSEASEGDNDGASEGDNDGASEETAGAMDKKGEKTAASDSGSGLARTGASVGILAALGAAATAVGGGVSYLRKRA